MMKFLARLLIAGSAITCVAVSAQAGDGDIGTLDQSTLERAVPVKHPYSPYAGRNFPSRPLFGDTHLHTSYSFDAGMAGALLGPDDAYRFAKSEEVVSNSGQRVKLSRPLDFLVVADHSDNLGWSADFQRGKPELLADPTVRRWYEMSQSGKGVEAFLELLAAYSTGTSPAAATYNPDNPAFTSAWQEIVNAAEAHNEPGRFTAFIGYEWTSNTNGNNLHRNVIFRDNGDKASQVAPFTTGKPLGSDNPRDLWKWMEQYEIKTGGRTLAIAHNGNLSNGTMFPVIESFTGKPIDLAYAEHRAKFEPLYEVTQMKGDSEAHPMLSLNDEFADFESWDKGNLDMSAPKKPEMLEFEYARSALKTGLKLAPELGMNPYKFGMVGSTDSHTGLTAVEEDNFFGKAAPYEPSAHRMEHAFIKGKAGAIFAREMASAGYAAVWAQENTRASIWDAMKRKETYATTGTRMAVRFFGGYEFTDADAQTRSPAIAGYTKGVPMGGDLAAAPEGKSPTFLVAALKDPIGANLDRYQIIKGWVDEKGETQEKVYDVAWGGDRMIGADGKLPPVGDTVDAANANWTNTIGAGELIAVWTDPDFDPTHRAFYYGRVLEIPTPRWTTYDAKYFGVELPPEVPASIQERAYTSPIWYTPAKS
jgi:hypothetical protein